jgi:hypothetical protein
MGELSDFAMQLILEDRIDEAQETLLAESIESDLIQSIGETSQLDYLLKMEKFFDDRDLYVYDGWEDAQVLSSPKIGKYFVTIDLRVPPNCELKGALRLNSSEEEEQNTTSYKTLEDGTHFVRFKILRRLLDKIEMAAKDRAEEITDKESEV